MPYSGNPSTSVLDAVRFWIQDCSDAPLFNDDELRYLIAQAADYSADPLLLASILCTPLSARFAGSGTISADGVSYSYEQLTQRFRDLASQLRSTWEELNRGKGAPYAGGTLWFDMTPWGTVPPVFWIGQFDNPFYDCPADPCGTDPTTYYQVI